MTTLAIIPARAGSKGIPGKNMALCAGQPLIEWTLDAALNSSVDAVIVSSDDGAVLNYTKNTGARWHPAEEITDEAQIEDRLPERFDPPADIIVLLQSTSPVRTSKQIDEAIEQLQREGADSLVSVVESHSFFWRDGTVVPTYDVMHRPRRQDMTKHYEENGSIYVFTEDHWRRMHNRLGGKISLFVMPEECAIQVDTPFDLWMAEKILERQHSLVGAGYEQLR